MSLDSIHGSSQILRQQHCPGILYPGVVNKIHGGHTDSQVKSLVHDIAAVQRSMHYVCFYLTAFRASVRSGTTVWSFYFFFPSICFCLKKPSVFNFNFTQVLFSNVLNQLAVLFWCKMSFWQRPGLRRGVRNKTHIPMIEKQVRWCIFLACTIGDREKSLSKCRLLI